MAAKIVHEPEKQRFTADCGDQLGVLEYALSAGSVNFHHTFVPQSCRGQGIAAALVDAAAAWARDEGLSIQASCWYAQQRLSV